MKNYITKLLLVFFVGFTLLQSCSKSDTSANNTTSNTVAIGNQVWMKKT